MDPSNLNGHYMRDQYLEMLWTAQKIEDRRLTELIIRRLKEMAVEIAVAPTPACEVIPFPGMPACINVPNTGYDAAPLLWPQQPLRHLLSILCGYCAVVLFFALFGLNA